MNLWTTRGENSRRRPPQAQPIIGHSHTRTVTDHHSEPVCGFVLPFDLPGLSVNGRRLGDRVAFEGTDFNLE